MLKVEHLSVTLDGKTLLEDVSLAIGDNERVGLIGGSGSGKSVLAAALYGTLPRGARHEGQVEVGVAAPPEGGQAPPGSGRIGAVSDAPDTLLPMVTIGDQVRQALQQARQAQDVADWLQRVGLQRVIADRYPGELTRAEERRIELALALIANPALLIVDDATAGLDAIGQRHLLDLVDRLCAERKIALLLISHDLKAIAMLCSRVVVLDSGKVVEAGDKAEVFGHPKHAVTRRILSAGRQRGRTLMRTPIGGSLLEVRGVAAAQAEPRLEATSFAIRAGEAIGVVGPAGAGQSTLVRIVAGLAQASSGEVELEQVVYHGADLPRTLRHRIGYLFPDPRASFNPRIKVGESVAEPLQLEVQKSLDELSARLIEVVRAVGISPDAMVLLPRAFSTGDLQRLAIARALITHPRLLVMDDPFSVLDVAARGEVLALLNRLRADYGLSILFAGTDLAMVAAATDRILVMDRGRIIETATPAQLLEKPQQVLTRQLVAAQLPDVGIVPVF